MAEEFLSGSFDGTEFGMGDRPSYHPVGREAVKFLLIGKPEAVQHIIHDLYTCRFCDPGVWSKPLTFPESREAIDRMPGEVLRIYKRYLTR